MRILRPLIPPPPFCPGLEVYPSRTQLPGLLPQPVLAGVVGGVCFLGVAVLVSILAACLMNRRRAARRHRKRLRQGRYHHSSSLGCSFPSTLIIPEVFLGHLKGWPPTSCLSLLHGPGAASFLPFWFLALHTLSPVSWEWGLGLHSLGLRRLFTQITCSSPVLTDPPLIFSPRGKSGSQ